MEFSLFQGFRQRNLKTLHQDFIRHPLFHDFARGDFRLFLLTFTRHTGPMLNSLLRRQVEASYSTNLLAVATHAPPARPVTFPLCHNLPMSFSATRAAEIGILSSLLPYAHSIPKPSAPRHEFFESNLHSRRRLSEIPAPKIFPHPLLIKRIH